MYTCRSYAVLNFGHAKDLLGGVAIEKDNVKTGQQLKKSVRNKILDFSSLFPAWTSLRFEGRYLLQFLCAIGALVTHREDALRFQRGVSCTRVQYCVANSGYSGMKGLSQMLYEGYRNLWICFSNNGLPSAKHAIEKCFSSCFIIISELEERKNLGTGTFWKKHTPNAVSLV